MKRHNLEPLFESWARWVHQGGLVAGYGSIMEKLITNRGVMCFGSGKGAPVVDCIESRIEAALMQLAVTNPQAVEAVRVEYGAVFIKGLKPDAVQFDKALKLGISLKTYKRRLKSARDHVADSLARS